MFKPISLPPAAARAEASRPSREIAQTLPVERDVAGLPVSYSRALDIDLPRRLYSAWIPASGARAIVRALLPEERLKLEGRARAIEIALQPFTEEQVGAVEAEIAAMFSGFRAMRQTGDDVAAVVEVTRRVLREFPLWAIAKACLMIAQNQATIDGKPLDRRFAPNDTEIYAVVTGVVTLRRKALASAQALLDAPVEVPEPQRPKEGPDLPRPHQAPQNPDLDGKHAQRVTADLAARKAKETTERICGND